MSLRDFGILTAVCLIWALNGVVSKIVVSTLEVEPLFYASVRFVIALLVVFPWLFPAPKPLWRVMVVGFLMGGGTFALLFVGLKTSTPSAAAIVGQLGVPITTVLSVLMLGERIHWRRGLGIGLALLGVIIVMWDPHGFGISTGLMLIAAGAFAGSLGAVMMKQVEGVRPLQFQAWVSLSSVLPIAVLSAIFEPNGLESGLAAGWPLVGALAFSALIVSVVAHTAYYGLIQRYEANLIAPLTLMAPLATIGFGIVLTGDHFGWRMAAGTAIALGGVLIIALRRSHVSALFFALRSRVG